MHLLKTPWIIRKLFSSYVWSLPGKEKTVYLTFDDGPHPRITPWLLDLLDQYNAKATFFCIGDNVRKFPAVYEEVLKRGHATGNHTFNHLNGWKTAPEAYLENIYKAAELIKSRLFRPPYGRIKKRQARMLLGGDKIPDRIIMWDVLSADWDKKISGAQVAKNVLDHVKAGSVVVFHDSEKAEKNLVYALPLVLEKLKEEGYSFEKIDEGKL